MTPPLNNLTCGFSPITDIGGVCSSRGACLFDVAASRGACFCEPGWQGESDFKVTNSKLDCQIDVLAVRALWGIVLFIHVAVYIKYLPKLKWLWDKHNSIVQRNKAAGKKYTLWDNKGLLSLVPYVTLGWWSQTAYMITKIVDQNHKIGDSVFITILYIIWRTTFFFCPDTFQPALVASLLKSQRNLDHVITLNRHLSNLHMGITMLIGIPCIIPLIVPQDEFDPRVGIASILIVLAGGSLSMLFLALQAIYIERKVQGILEKSYEISKEQRTKRIMEKMALNQRQVIVSGFINFVVYGVFACFPYLWNKHDYLLPFAWVMVANTIRQVIWSLVQEETNQSSTRGSVPDNMSDPNNAMVASPQQIHHAPPESTVVGTMDTTSIVEVDDEENPALLATGKKWTKAKVETGDD